ncbi:polysaccharide deacetylase family protein [Chitinibacter bivalviorum]|uniref:Polysaccharide deacetylase family protein n=1 Tax=Chitinibacter bivalviorum TaxID=2739434 RepID=A0A7H9BGL8_9NEIS|nr:polysaccharide deacetylase family protein [Chitinibacter bivalviorum]QLG87562.1 polysaccharide deacetylase family protein [Chitinibacter bivalviorum]
MSYCKMLATTFLLFSVSLVSAATPQTVRTPFVENWGQVPLATLERQAKTFEGTYYLEGLGNSKVVALTYDDGPSKDTPALLDVLKKNNVKATFFWLGSNIEKHPDIAKRALAEGHTLGNHSYNHPNLSDLQGDTWWTDQLAKTQDVYRKVLGVQPKLMRPPYGFLRDAQIEALKAHEMKAILWSVDTADWYHTHTIKNDLEASQKIAGIVNQYVHPEAIILMHDAGGRGRVPTLMATELFIGQLKSQGYGFVTVDQLIKTDVAKAQ